MTGFLINLYEYPSYFSKFILMKSVSGILNWVSSCLDFLDVFTGRNEVVAKVMFLHVCVILFTGGSPGRPPSWQGEPPPPAGRTLPGTRQTPPGRENPSPAGRTPPPGPGRHPPWDQADTAPPPPGRRLQHTVNERPVRVLLECILVDLACVFA